MDDRLKKVQAGDELSAKQYNLLINATKKANSAKYGIDNPGGMSGRDIVPNWQPSTSDLQRHSRQELYLAVPETLEYDGDSEHWYFECRIYWQDGEYYPEVNPDWWITPDDETKRVYIADSADGSTITLNDPTRPIIVLGNYAWSEVRDRDDLIYTGAANETYANGQQQSWHGTAHTQMHPGDASVYARAWEGGPLDNQLNHPANHLEQMVLTTAEFAGPGDFTDEGWKILLQGNRQPDAIWASTSWVDFRTGEVEVTFQVPPPAGYKIQLYYDSESAWDYMWIQTHGGAGNPLRKGTLIDDETFVAGNNIFEVAPDSSGTDVVDVHIWEGAKNVKFDPDETKYNHEIWFMADEDGTYQYIKGFGLAWYYGNDP